MTTLQWALLVLGAGIIVALIVSGRRERRSLDRWSAGGEGAPPDSRRDWAMSQAAPGGPEEERDFDEYGVGRPRKRNAPQIGVSPPLPTAPRPAPAVEARPGRAPPAFLRAPGQEKVVGFYIAEHEGTSILGPKIHAALKEQGLRFGAKNIYHRLDGQQPQFSVASLVKPGHLDPAEAVQFSTPGLSVFLVLPGPASPQAAYADMLHTARALAKALNAELYDSELREPLTDTRAQALQRAVEDWARRNAAPTV